RHAVECGASLVMDRCEHAPGVERLDDAETAAMREGAHDADDTAEAVEQRHTETQAIVRREPKHFAGRVAVVENVAAGEHHPLGKSSGSRRGLHGGDRV